MTAATFPSVSGTTRVFGCIASPVDHVRAPTVFNALFAERGLDHVMVPINAPADDLQAVIEGLRRMPNFGGMAVTIPHKVTLAGLCDTLGAAARLTGAVNAIRFDDDGSMHGDNFDGAGFVAGMQQQGHDPAGMMVLIVGAGGAARAIALALRDAGTKKIMISNRTAEKAAAIASALAMAGDTAPVEAVRAHDGSKVDLIVNTTSLGMHDGDPLPLPLDAVDEGTLIADIIMSPTETAWMKSAGERGLSVHPGRHMLDCQIELIGSFTGAL